MDNSRVAQVLGAIGRPLSSEQPPSGVSGWLTGLGVAAVFGAIWTLTYVTGGTHTAMPHAFYVPIVLAAAVFGVPGGLVAALVAGLLAGPLMPLDVEAGSTQPAFNWLMRGLFFALVGGTVGGLFTARRRSYAAAFEAHLARGLDDYPEVTPSAQTLRQVRDVLDQHTFHAVFQPIYALDDGRLRAVEALTRFDTELCDPPDVWFARANHVGLEVELDLSTIEAALVAAHHGLPADVSLSLNCWPATICDDRLVTLIDRFPPRHIILEITEHAAVDDYHQLEQILPTLRARGIALAVDDTGAGFASLRHILRLAPEIIKLDISLTQGLHHDPVRRTLAECLIRFASRTGSELVAEGIEDHADLAAWREMGADAAQGFLLGRPGDLPAVRASPLIVDSVQA